MNRVSCYYGDARRFSIAPRRRGRVYPETRPSQACDYDCEVRRRSGVSRTLGDISPRHLALKGRDVARDVLRLARIRGIGKIRPA